MSWEYTNGIKNGGRTVTIEGESGDTTIACTFKAISAYNVSFESEYDSLFTTYSGKEIKDCKGTRFSLSLTAYGLSKDEVDDIATVVNTGDFTLVCDDYSGTVNCTKFNASLKSSNFYGTFYTVNMDFTAADLITAGGSL